MCRADPADRTRPTHRNLQAKAACNATEIGHGQALESAFQFAGIAPTVVFITSAYSNLPGFVVGRRCLPAFGAYCAFAAATRNLFMNKFTSRARNQKLNSVGVVIVLLLFLLPALHRVLCLGTPFGLRPESILFDWLREQARPALPPPPCR